MIEKINIKALADDFEERNEKERRALAHKLLAKVYQANVNTPETELIFARHVRNAIQNGSFDMGYLEQALVDAWTKKSRIEWGAPGYWAYRDAEVELNDAISDLYHFDLAKRFASFARKAIAESRKLQAETARRKKLLSEARKVAA